VSRGRSNACNPLAPRIDKNLGNSVVKRCRSVRLRIVGRYVFYPSTMAPPVPHTPSTMVSHAPSTMVSRAPSVDRAPPFRYGESHAARSETLRTLRKPNAIGHTEEPGADELQTVSSTREPAEPMNQQASPAERGLRAGRILLANHGWPRGGAHPVPGARCAHQINFLSYH
jgi:hypothetical protein